MPELKNVNVGPIVGATTGNSVRLWGRGKSPGENGLKVHGVARVHVGPNDTRTQFFKMMKTWDYSGVAILSGLTSKSSYQYQVAWFLDAMDTEEIIENPPALDWDAIDIHTFKTGSDDDDDARSYFVGSCRYNLPWAKDDKDHTDTRGDKTFRAMVAQLDATETSGLIMLGDQIYADILGIGAKSPKQFFRLYRGAFRQESLRALMSSVPTYMTLDDHEIEDNWPAKKGRGDVDKEVAAKYAYQAYQVSHSPLLGIANGQLDELPSKFYYEFHDGCCDFFIIDSRTERDLVEKTMISEKQLRALLAFLSRNTGRVKMVCTGVPFFPDGGKDKWSGFSDQRGKILNFIRKHKIEKVVFLSGDVHFSAAYELKCNEQKDFRVYSLVCSPFFWPFPHFGRLKHKKIQHKSKTYQSKTIVKAYRGENFVRLNVTPNSIQFEVYPRKNPDPVRSKALPL